jgi:hypothetical protein
MAATSQQMGVADAGGHGINQPGDDSDGQLTAASSQRSIALTPVRGWPKSKVAYEDPTKPRRRTKIW